MAQHQASSCTSVLRTRFALGPRAAGRGHVRAGLLGATALVGVVGCSFLGLTSPLRAQVPTGSTVVGGQATITTGPNQVTVTQSTSRGVVDWRTFSIGRGARADFHQPGAASVTLTRVTGADPSVIAGRLTANGQIILVNGAGVFFANGAQVNVGALVASMANISNSQRYMAGGSVTFDVRSPTANANASASGIPPVVYHPPDIPTPPVGTSDVLVLEFASDRSTPTPLGLTTVILVNQGNEYLFNVDEEQRKRRAARGGK